MSLKIKLNTKTLKNLSRDSRAIPGDLTPQVVGGGLTPNTTNFQTYWGCGGTGTGGGGGGDATRGINCISMEAPNCKHKGH